MSLPNPQQIMLGFKTPEKCNGHKTDSNETNLRVSQKLTINDKLIAPSVFPWIIATENLPRDGIIDNGPDYLSFTQSEIIPKCYCCKQVKYPYLWCNC